MRLTTKLAAVFATVAALAGSRAQAAGTATGTFTVSAVVNPTCTISGAALSFGSYDPNSGTPVDGQTTLTLACTKNTAYSITLASGNGSGSTFAMKETGGTVLDYVLYSNADRAPAHAWNPSTPVTGTAGGRAAIPLTVYGRIPINQDVTTGAAGASLNYSDTVTATVSF